MQISQIRDILLDYQIIADDEPIEVTSLSGGVSSDIQLVRFGNQSIVFKQALEQLKVKDEWLANRERNHFEQAFFHYMDQVDPNCVPKILLSNSAEGYFAMEYLEGYEMWKSELLKGHFIESRARQAAILLAGIHNTGYKSKHWEKTFDSSPNFFELRIDPYLLSTAEKHPTLASVFEEEARRLESHMETVVHGDYSPKNIMINSDRFILLDHEVAHFGDPAFDIAFMSTHLFLKLLMNPSSSANWSPFVSSFWETYYASRVGNDLSNLKKRSIHLLQLLMLARVDGKSPVEYFGTDSREQHFIRSFIHEKIGGLCSFEQFRDEWLKSIRSL